MVPVPTYLRIIAIRNVTKTPNATPKASENTDAQHARKGWSCVVRSHPAHAQLNTNTTASITVEQAGRKLGRESGAKEDLLTF